MVTKIDYHKDHPFYKAYVQESVITGVILSYLATSNIKFNSIKIVLYTQIVILILEGLKFMIMLLKEEKIFFFLHK